MLKRFRNFTEPKKDPLNKESKGRGGTHRVKETARGQCYKHVNSRLLVAAFS